MRSEDAEVHKCSCFDALDNTEGQDALDIGQNLSDCEAIEKDNTPGRLLVNIS